MKRIVTVLFCSGLALAGCAEKMMPAVAQNSRPIAFPGAEGFGKYTTGGRGGQVLIVTNLNDDGEGSLRKLLKKKGPKIIVFAVSGTIHLQAKLSFPSDVTVAGQSAPGDGICLADYPVTLGGDNIIIRYMRFRMGDKNQKSAKVDGSGSDDAFGGTHRKNIIIDHCSVSWSTDEVFSVYSGDSTTLQWNLISEPLNYSYHFEAGDTDFEHHGYGGIWGGRHTTGHHNLFAHCASRTPRFDGIRNSPEELVDFRNNVIYNWGNNNTYAGEGGRYNVVNNYYKPGPSTTKSGTRKLVNPFKKPPTIPYGKFYIDGNYLQGSPDITTNNWLGVTMDKGTDADKELAKVTAPFASELLPTQSAAEAYKKTLQFVGASLRRDTLDQRIINDVVNGTGRFIDVQGGYPHGTPYEISKTAWPVLQSEQAQHDTDKDGMPDAWEREHGLDPGNADDSAGNKLDNAYTNVEVYLNSLVPSVTL